MRSKLKEGMIIMSDKFVRGKTCALQGIVANYLVGTFPSEDEAAWDEEERGDRQYVILSVTEKAPYEPDDSPHIRAYYRNTILAQELARDGSFQPEGIIIAFTTAPVENGAIREEEILHIGEMQVPHKQIPIQLKAETNSAVEDNFMVEDLNHKIKELHNQIVALEKEKEEFLALNEEQQLAVYLHTKQCRQSHEDYCGWFYEVNKGQHNWQGSSHHHWLERAGKIINVARENEISLSAALKVIEANRN